MNEQQNSGQTAATPKAKKQTLTTAQRLAALEAKKQKLIEQSRKEETRKKIIFGAAMMKLMVDILKTDSRLAGQLISAMRGKLATADRPLFEEVVAGIREKAAQAMAAKKTAEAQAK